MSTAPVAVRHCLLLLVICVGGGCASYADLGQKQDLRAVALNWEKLRAGMTVDEVRELGFTLLGGVSSWIDTQSGRSGVVYAGNVCLFRFESQNRFQAQGLVEWELIKPYW